MDVKLMTWTKHPRTTICWAFANMHNVIPNDLEQFAAKHIESLGKEGWEGMKNELLEVLALNPHSSVLEFVNTVWFIGGCSRAFQQQLTRTRDAAYSIQSLRIVDVEHFADNKDYQIGETISRNAALSNKYADTMNEIQGLYKTFLAEGAKTEDARGILPLNINSPITMSINLRSLQHMLEVRLCHLAQGEFRSVASMMVEEMANKMGEGFRKLFQKPCDKVQFCPMPINCGKTKYKLDKRYEDKNLSYWLKG